ncbi:hypothetical protein HA402_014352 [Bradysia odoriphaga]|nr:hypothetical protein HA402_014352 [Bradysia odoriphaga]
MSINITTSFVIAGLIRFLLIISKYAQIIQNRIEISTPLNSWKRVSEGAFMYNANINPYTGDMYHENPLILVATNFLINKTPLVIPYLIIALDLAAGWLLYKMAQRFIHEMYDDERRQLNKFAKDSEPLHIKTTDLTEIPVYVAMAYLFNPYSVLNCVGLTTTVWSNFLLAGFFYCLSRKNTVFSCLFLSLETQRNFYPFVLIVPAMLILSRSGEKLNKAKMVQVLVIYLSTFVGLNFGAFYLIQDWNFLNATFGFIFYHTDLQPNIGLFWYFFTEMFEHFRTLFLYTFQMNATVLYLFPLTIKLHKKPLLLATILMALITIFRSYPCIGDVAFYMALFPLWKSSARFMANNFIVFCFLLITSALGPIVWYLWIYCNSANANFYFGATLAFASAQIFLVTDLLFASNKREFCLREGLGVISKIALE